jgi:hypothetical protein
MPSPIQGAKPGWRTIELDVSAWTIETSLRNKSNRCMLADAVKIAVPDATHINVDTQTIRFSDPTTQKRYVYLTPPRAADYVVDFDAGRDIVPFHVRLRNPMTAALGSTKRATGKTQLRMGSRQTQHERKAATVKTTAPKRMSTTARAYGRRTLRENQLRDD